MICNFNQTCNYETSTCNKFQTKWSILKIIKFTVCVYPINIAVKFENNLSRHALTHAEIPDKPDKIENFDNPVRAFFPG